MAQALDGRFYTGRPCRQCGQKIRYVSNFVCVACQIMRTKRSQARRKERQRVARVCDTC